MIRERVVRNQESQEEMRRFAEEQDPDRTTYRDIIQSVRASTREK